MGETLRVPAGEGGPVLVGEGQCFRVVDVAGGQVGDLFASHRGRSRRVRERVGHPGGDREAVPQEGDPVLTNRRRPILSVLEDTSPGWHDMLYAACDPARYASLGALAAHRSCAGNLAEALAARGLEG